MSRRPGRASAAGSWRSHSDQDMAYAKSDGGHQPGRSTVTTEVHMPEGLWLGPVIGLYGANLQWLKEVSGARKVIMQDHPQPHVVILASEHQQAACAARLLNIQLDQRMRRGRLGHHLLINI